MLVPTEETFGPVAPVVTVSSFEDGLDPCLPVAVGLAATAYTRDADHMTAAARLPAG